MKTSAYQDSAAVVISLSTFSSDYSAPAIREVGLKVTNLISANKDEIQVRMQKTILDYMSMPDMPSLNI